MSIESLAETTIVEEIQSSAPSKENPAGSDDTDLAALLENVRSCRICEDYLPLGPRPILQFHPRAKILIAGQAPGRKVHESGVPFQDVSGDRLREWLGLTSAAFYDPQNIAILPMGFCFPGTGKSGDLPPRPECAPAWREKLLRHLTEVRLTIIIGQYAQAYHLPMSGKSVTGMVMAWRAHYPDLIPLPHPQPTEQSLAPSQPLVCGGTPASFAIPCRGGIGRPSPCELGRLSIT